MIVSSLDPRRTFLDLLDPGYLPAELVEALRRYTFRGSSGKVNLALDGLPELACLPGSGSPSERRDLDQPQRGLHRAGL